VRKGVKFPNHNQTLLREKSQTSMETQLSSEVECKVRKGMKFPNHNQTLVADKQ
jgi:hypothetical protein